MYVSAAASARDGEAADGELAVGGGNVVVELRADEIRARRQIERVLIIVEPGSDFEADFRVGDDEIHVR